jgi:hypothetical protein
LNASILQSQTYVLELSVGFYICSPTKNITDALSRLIKENVTEPTAKSSATEDYVKLVATESTPVAMTTREMERASEGDQELRAVQECLVNGQWHRITYKEYLPIRNELCEIRKLVLRGTRIVVPTILHEHVLELAHEGHPGIVLMKTCLRSKVWWPGIDKSI